MSESRRDDLLSSSIDAAQNNTGIYPETVTTNVKTPLGNSLDELLHYLEEKWWK